MAGLVEQVVAGDVRGVAEVLGQEPPHADQAALDVVDVAVEAVPGLDHQVAARLGLALGRPARVDPGGSGVAHAGAPSQPFDGSLPGGHSTPSGVATKGPQASWCMSITT